MSLLFRAFCFARHAHGAVSQKRKYTGEPYIVHPAHVVQILCSETGQAPTEAMLAAAFLHDTVEDTNATLMDIERNFGNPVAAYVEQLTNVASPSDGNRAARKRIDLEHLVNASPSAQTIKLADILSNVPSIYEHDREFAAIYLPEKLAQLEVLKAGDRRLWLKAHKMILNYLFHLGLERNIALGKELNDVSA